jgi:hypothetical protein
LVVAVTRNTRPKGFGADGSAGSPVSYSVSNKYTRMAESVGCREWPVIRALRRCRRDEGSADGAAIACPRVRCTDLHCREGRRIHTQSGWMPNVIQLSIHSVISFIYFIHCIQFIAFSSFISFIHSFIHSFIRLRARRPLRREERRREGGGEAEKKRSREDEKTGDMNAKSSRVRKQCTRTQTEREGGTHSAAIRAAHHPRH